MEHSYKREQLPSGKIIMRHFDGDGAILEETHAHGPLAVAIKYNFNSGKKVDETYIVKSRMVGRRSYEKARAAYPDMPAADCTIQDLGAEMLRAIAKERREMRAAAKCHLPDAAEAAKLDAFCTMMMDRGKRDNASIWIQSKGHTLGERSWSSSKRLVDRLTALGCLSIYACEIIVYEDGLENTGHLVIELPEHADVRNKILKAVARLASDVGCSGNNDDGQRYVYIKLD